MQFETYQQQRDGLIRLAGDLSAALKGVPEAKGATVKTLTLATAAPTRMTCAPCCAWPS